MIRFAGSAVARTPHWIVLDASDHGTITVLLNRKTLTTLNKQIGSVWCAQSCSFVMIRKLNILQWNISNNKHAYFSVQTCCWHCPHWWTKFATRNGYVSQERHSNNKCHSILIKTLFWTLVPGSTTFSTQSNHLDCESHWFDQKRLENLHKFARVLRGCRMDCS